MTDGCDFAFFGCPFVFYILVFYKEKGGVSMEYFKQLNSTHLDILKEIGNIGAGNAATALSTLLNKKIDMKVPSVKILSFNEIMDYVGGADKIVASVFLHLEGDALGSMFFILSTAQAERFITGMIGVEASVLNLERSDLAHSALQEMGNIVSGSYLASLSDFTKLDIYPSVPVLVVDMIGAILGYGLMEISTMGDYAIVIDTAVFEDDKEEVEGHFFLLPDPNSIKVIFESLGISDV